MNPVMTRTLCRMLITLMVWMPFQLAQAAMIDTDQVVTSTGQADRTAVLNLLSRSEAASQMQVLGVDLATAKDRVMAMSDAEVGTLARTMESAPAGANGVSGGTLVLVIVIIAVVWWAMTK